MKTIVISTDFSNSALNAAKYGCNLAIAMQVDVVLLHTYIIPIPFTPVTLSDVPIVPVKEIKDSLKSQLATLAHDLKSEYGISIKPVLKEGDYADETQKVVDSFDADLVIMGLGDKNNITKAIFGSSTVKVIEEGNYPVLIIPSGVVYKKPENIVFATDFHLENNPEPLIPLRKLAEKLDAQIKVLHVVKEDKPLEATFPMASIQIDHFLTPLKHTFHLEEEHDTIEGIEEFIEGQKADMMAIVHHKHTFFEKIFKGSHSKKLIFIAQIPILVMQG